MNIQSFYCCVLLEYALCLFSVERQSRLSDISQSTVQASDFDISRFRYAFLLVILEIKYFLLYIV
jgi:hypothetical protein